MDGVRESRKPLGWIVVSDAPVKTKPPLSAVDNGSHQKRVMGLEPTTFTLATCAATAPNEQDDKDLDDGAGVARSAGAARSGCPLSGDTELAAVVAAWPAMPAAIRRAVLALVGTVTGVAETKTPADGYENGGLGDGDAGDAGDRDALAGDSNAGVVTDAAGGGV